MTIRGLWESQKKLITGIRLGYYDLATQNVEGIYELLARWEKLRMKNTGIIAMTNIIFSSFVLLVETIMGEGGTNSTCYSESTHGRKNGQTHFSR